VTSPDIVGAISTVLDELIAGAGLEAGCVLNPHDPGLLSSLAKLSAQEASAIPTAGGASIAAHVDHLRYGLQLLNRWSQGDDPFADADYGPSWDRLTVSEAEWVARREALRREADAWREAIKTPREFTDFELTGVVASAAHLAYHLGAIRQMNRAIRGPSERE
jgi:hypothetical protein